MKKKLLFIINTMGRAGAETALIELLKKLDALGEFELSLYTIIPRGELFSRVPDNVRILNRCISCGSVLSAAGRAAIFFRAVYSFFYHLTGFRMLPYLFSNIAQQKKTGHVQYDKLLWRLLAEGTPARKESYDLAVAYIEGAAAYYLSDRVRADHKAAFIHIDYQQAGYLPMMDRNCYDYVERIFVVSNEVGRKFISLYPQYHEKVFLFRNILDCEGIVRKAENGVGFEDGFTGVRLVTVGRLTYQKGYDIAVDVMAQLRADGYHVRWYIIGEGPERSNLERLTESLGVKDDFILLGAKDNPYPYIKQADIYVHATRFEGKSIAIEEAQVLQKPIVASDCTGNTEQITPDYDGILLTLNKDNLVRSLEWLIDRPDIQKELSLHSAERKLVYPEDLNNLLDLMKEHSC